MIYDVIIIGGGPAGLYSAGSLSQNSKDSRILLLEKNSKLGLKLLISGSGQCNFTHSGSLSEFYSKYGNNRKFVKECLNKTTNKDVIKTINLPVMEDDNGKIFPKSLKATDVLDSLLGRIRSNAEIRCNSPAVDVIKEGEFYRVKLEKNSELCRNVIIATGGKTFPSTGSTGDGYKFAQSLGHSVTDLKPGLTGVESVKTEFGEISGVSLQNIKITIESKEKKNKEFYGDILFTGFGLSGPVIINNARDISVGDTININIIGKSYDVFSKEVLEIMDKNGQRNINFLVNSIDIPKSLGNFIIDKIAIKEDTKLSELKKEKRKELVKYIVSYPMEVSKLRGDSYAMVTVGGVSLNEINKKTMMSKLAERVFFAGEVMDIDGDSGGYNIQFAFSSGDLASSNILKSIKNDK